MSILNETVLPIHEAAASLPGNRPGTAVAFSTVFRWILRGCRAIDGRRVRLEAVRLGSRWLTSREALERFSDALTNPASGDATDRTPTGRKRDVSAARKKLEKMGI